MSEIWFVPQAGTEEDNRDTRKSIRRHVMLGKNQGRVSNLKQPKLDGCAVFRIEDWNSDAQSFQSVIPHRVGTDLSFLEFADAVELPLMNDTLQFCSATNEKLFMLEPCISFGSTDIAATCIQALASDALHLNVMVFATQLYIDQIFWQTTSRQREGASKASLRHYGKALSLLRGRLAGTEKQRAEISDIVIISVITLASHALVTGEVGSARNHMFGLSRLVRMREDGLYSFADKTKQMIEILRCDLCLSLATGQVPMFFSDLSCEPLFPLPELAAPDKTSQHRSITMDDELTIVWDVLHQFCATINTAADNRSKVSDQILLQTMASVMYRLLTMSVTADSSDEAFRLAMISFCASALLPFRQLQMHLGWLQFEHKRSLTSLMESHPGILDPEVLLWCLLMYGIAFSSLSADESDELRKWLLEVTGLCNLTDWDSIREIAHKFLWIGIICDHPAEMLIQKALAKQITASEVSDMPS